MTFIQQAETPQDAAHAEGWWWRVIRLYAMRKLTIEDDKLPALSGLAQVYREVTHDSYLAGLWKASLLCALCWYYKKRGVWNEEEIVIGCRPKRYRVPSWSWASVETRENFECYQWNTECARKN